MTHQIQRDKEKDASHHHGKWNGEPDHSLVPGDSHNADGKHAPNNSSGDHADDEQEELKNNSQRGEITGYRIPPKHLWDLVRVSV